MWILAVLIFPLVLLGECVKQNEKYHHRGGRRRRRF
jgi:hypothetical protein